MVERAVDTSARSDGKRAGSELAPQVWFGAKVLATILRQDELLLAEPERRPWLSRSAAA